MSKAISEYSRLYRFEFNSKTFSNNKGSVSRKKVNLEKQRRKWTLARFYRNTTFTWKNHKNLHSEEFKSSFKEFIRDEKKEPVS